ncbi:MAG: hypothetical protein NUV69_03280 [Candidatus Curtissbacteria bacterium]|nr:hypothetical protein [Candidatus Curtissbacteria bacterium]
MERIHPDVKKTIAEKIYDNYAGINFYNFQRQLGWVKEEEHDRGIGKLNGERDRVVRQFAEYVNETCHPGIESATRVLSELREGCITEESVLEFFVDTGVMDSLARIAPEK